MAGSDIFHSAILAADSFVAFSGVRSPANCQLQGRFLGLFLVLMETSILMETMESFFHNFIISNYLQQQPFRGPLPKVPGEGVSEGSGNDWP